MSNIINGTSGNDDLTGTSADDLFKLYQGGDDTAHGLGGNDIFEFNAAFTAADTVDGGTGNDTVRLTGDYSAGVTLGATTLTSVEQIQFGAGFDYNLTTDDANVASGATLTLNANALGSANSLIFNGSAETDGSFRIDAGAGNDTLTGGAGADTFDLRLGGEDTVQGGGGNDLILVGAHLDAGDRIDGGLDGGLGTNIVRLDGDYSAGLVLGADTLQNIQVLQFTAGHSYNLTADNANFLSGPTVFIEAGSLGAGDALTFNGSAVDANFDFIGGAGNDVLTGGTAADVFDLSKGGNDIVHGGGLGDKFVMGGTLTSADQIDGGSGNDTVELSGMGAADAIVFSATTMVNVETLLLDAGHNYDLTTADATVAAGATLLVRGEHLGAGDTLTFDGSAETNGHFIIRGGAGNDTLTGGQDGDTFNLTVGGEDTVTGGAGNDTIAMGASFDSGDQIDGGAGSDTLSLDGTYASAITVSGTMVQNVETVALAGGGYNITWQSAIASGLTVDASAIGSGDSVVFDDTALATGNVHFIGGAGESVFRGGGGDDVIDVQNSTNGLNVSGGGGDDTVNFGAAYGSNPFQAADGGTGSNTATFDGDYSAGVTVGPSTFFGPIGLRDFQTIELLGDHSYAMTFDDSHGSGATLTGGAALTVDASALGAGDQTLLDFSLSDAPGFTITGGAGDDDFVFAANFAASDAVNGGAGSDTLELKGDYSAGLTFGASTMTNVETLQLDDGFSYKLTTNDATAASGATLTVDASALTGTNALTFDGSAETNGFFAITGGAGDDTITLGSHFSVNDSIDGGAGDDTVNLTNVHGTFNFTATTIQNVEDLVVTVTDGFAIAITTTDANVAAGATMTVDFSNSGPVIGTGVTFDGSAETDGHFAFIEPHFAGGSLFSITGGALSDTLSFTHGDGSLDNTFNGLGGDDTVTTAVGASTIDFDGGTGNDTLAFTGGGTENQSYNLTSVENVTFDDNNWTVVQRFASAVTSLNVDATALSGGHTLTFSGVDTIDGPGSADDSFVFEFAGNFISADSLTGSDGNDTLSLDGDYSGGITFGASTISSIETITVADGHTYDFVTDDANVASGATLTVDASALTGGNQLFFDGSAETDGHFAFIGGAADDDLEGGAQSDTFDLSRSDGAFVSGNGGNDSFTVTSAAKLLDDSIDGGAGSDTLILNGDFSTQTAITSANIARIETLQLLGAGNSYNLVLDPGIAGAGTFTVDGSAASSVTVDASGAPATAYEFLGSAGNDTLTGGSQNDGFNLTLGGNDTVSGGAGNDTFSFGGTFTAADTVNGGANSDTISLSGDYSAGLTFSATNMTSVETLALNPGHSYNLTTNDANVASGATLNVFASSLGAGDTLTFDGAAETNGAFAITSGAGTNTLTGGAGNDTITLGSNFSTTASTIDGGAGSDTLNLVNVTGSYTFTASTITNVEDLAITVTDGTSASFTTNDANVAAGATMIVDFSSSGPEFGINSLTFDGSAETDGHFAFIEPAFVNAMTLTGGALSDTLSFTHGDGGDNSFNGLGGDDTATTTANAGRLNFDGGTGNDTLAFTGGGTENGDYFFTSVENVTFDDNNWTVNQRFQGASESLNVDATALSGGHTLTFNGVDTVDGPGIAEDSFVFEFAGNFISGDSLTGGDGNDTLSLDGDYSAGFTFGAAQLTSIETITLAAGHSYNLTTNDGNVASGATLTVDASALGTTDTLDFNGSAETDGSFIIDDGGSNGAIITSRHGDTVTFLGGDGNSVTAGHDAGANIDSFDFATSTNTTMIDGPDTYTVTIDNFSQSAGDRIHLTGSDTASYAIAHQTEAGGNTVITLNDGSTIHLIGVGSVDASFFS